MKKGQVTIFIIIAVIVVAAVAIVLMVSPGLRKGIGIEKAENPESFIQTCLESTLQENVELMALQGGSLEPEKYFLYENEKLQYLCHTDNLYETCYVEVPFIAKAIEDELTESISGVVSSCFNDLRESYDKKGYKVKIEKGDYKVELLPKRILATINYDFTFTKGDEVKRQEIFRVVLNNNLYELSRIASSIVDWEEVYGDADPIAYMALYPEYKVEKHLQNDGTAVYIITDRETENKFQFASRSLLTSVAQL